MKGKRICELPLDAAWEITSRKVGGARDDKARAWTVPEIFDARTRYVGLIDADAETCCSSSLRLRAFLLHEFKLISPLKNVGCTRTHRRSAFVKVLPTHLEG